MDQGKASNQPLAMDRKQFRQAFQAQKSMSGTVERLASLKTLDVPSPESNVPAKTKTNRSRARYDDDGDQAERNDPSNVIHEDLTMAQALGKEIKTISNFHTIDSDPQKQSHNFKSSDTNPLASLVAHEAKGPDLPLVQVKNEARPQERVMSISFTPDTLKVNQGVTPDPRPVSLLQNFHLATIGQAYSFPRQGQGEDPSEGPGEDGTDEQKRVKHSNLVVPNRNDISATQINRTQLTGEGVHENFASPRQALQFKETANRRSSVVETPVCARLELIRSNLGSLDTKKLHLPIVTTNGLLDSPLNVAKCLSNRSRRRSSIMSNRSFQRFRNDVENVSQRQIELAESIRYKQSSRLNYRLEQGDRANKIKALKHVMKAFQGAIDSYRDNQLYDELLNENSYVDPTPDLVEGIFYLDQSLSWASCCGKQKPKEDGDSQEPSAASTQPKKVVVYDRRSLYLFDHTTRFRKAIVAFTQSNLFEAIIVLAIFLNSLTLAATDYSDRNNETEHNQKLERIGTIFSYIFTLELVLKVIAMGFIKHSRSYLRDSWNWLDFIVVVTGLIELVAGDKGAKSVRALRVLRVLRPLKSINAFPKMRRLISALLSSLPNLGNAVLFMLFIFLLFGILGVQQFGGMYYHRCRYAENPSADGSWPVDESIPYLCSKDLMGDFMCPKDRFCRAPSDAGLSISIDDVKNDESIDYGITVFDSLPIGLITVFQMITLEGWTKIMYNLQDSSISWMAVLFSICLIVIGSFFLLNVILAVLAEALTNVDEIHLKAIASQNRVIAQSLQRRRLQEDKLEAIEASKDDSLAEQESLSREAAKINARSSLPSNLAEESSKKATPKEQAQLAEDLNIGSEDNGFQGLNPLSLSSFDPNQSGPSKEQTPLQQQRLAPWLTKNTCSNLERKQDKPMHIITSSSNQSSQSQQDSELRRNNSPDIILGQLEVEAFEVVSESSLNDPERPVLVQPTCIPGEQGAGDSATATHGKPSVNPSSISDGQMRLLRIEHQKSRGPSQFAKEHKKSEVEGESETNRALIRPSIQEKGANHERKLSQMASPVPATVTGRFASDFRDSAKHLSQVPLNESRSLPMRAQRNWLFRVCYLIVTHWTFTVTITFLIITNTAVLALDKFPRDLEREAIADQLNNIFSWCFVAEMIIKVTGLGFREYGRDTFNLFDAILVVISLVDYAFSHLPDVNADSGGGLSAFRGIRLLRVFKLARSWTSFRLLLAKIILTVKEITTFSILLIICMFIFTLLGMEIFGHRVQFDELERIVEPGNSSVELVAPRPNFDSFFMAFTTIFIVFIGEDWQLAMHSHYRIEGSISIFFFALMYIFLNLILLNLFLAILLQNFELATEQEKQLNVNHQEDMTLKRLVILLRRICYFCRKGKKVTPDGQAQMEESDESFNQLDGQPVVRKKLVMEELFNQSSSFEEYSDQVDPELSDYESYSSRSDTELAKLPNKISFDKEAANEQAIQSTRRVGMPQKLSSLIQDGSPDPFNTSQRVPHEINIIKVTESSLAASEQEAEQDKEDEDKSEQAHGDNSVPQKQKPAEEATRQQASKMGQISQQTPIESGAAIADDSSASKSQNVFNGSMIVPSNPELIEGQRSSSLKRAKTLQIDEKLDSSLNRNSPIQKSFTSKRRQSMRHVDGKKLEIQRKKSLLKTTDVNMSLAKLKLLELIESKKKRKQKKVHLKGKSCGLFNRDNCLRRFCKAIYEFEYFDSLVLLLIGISTILLTLDNPLRDENGTFATSLSHIDNVITVLFTLECFINIMVLGFVFNGPQSYMRDSWNVLDFLIVFFSLFSLATVDLELGFLRVFRMLRVLRPLRVLKRNFGLKIQVVSLINSIPGIANLLAITMLLLMLFGIQGVNFFAGKMFYCNTENMPEAVRSRVKSEWDCYDYGGEWLQHESHFDNVGRAMLTMFTMMTTEGWINVMWLATDATEVHQVPRKNNQLGFIIFFIAFLIFGSLFILNLFVGVVLNTFNQEKDKLSNNNKLTRLQTEYLEVMMNCYKIGPLRRHAYTGNRVRDLCKDVAEANWFNALILACIILNSVCLSITWYGEPDGLVFAMEWINIGFTIIYSIEMLIKLIAFKRSYFLDGWNVFDFLIVIFAWVGLVADFVFEIEVGALTTVVRAFRILRVLKLIRTAKNLQKILNTFLLAIPELANVGALLFLFLFLFSVLGVFLFSGIRLQTHLNRNANFQHFGSALLTLFRITTGEGWQDIMYDCARQRDIMFQCVESQTFDEQQRDGINGCGTPVAYIYFVSFTLVVSLIFLNLFIAIILEGQLQATQQQEARVGDPARLAYVNAWKNYDPDATGFIEIESLRSLIMDLTEKEISLRSTKELRSQEYVIFNFSLNSEIRALTKLTRGMPLTEKENAIKGNLRLKRSLDKALNGFMSEMQIPIYNKMRHYNFYDVLNAFVKIVFSQAHRRNFEERQRRIEDADKAGTTQLLGVIDQIKRKDPAYWQLDLMDQEVFLEADDPDFQTVINRLENKGNSKSMQIIMLNEVRKLRQKAGRKIKDSIDLDYFGDAVLDSRHVVGAKVILRMWNERKERRAKAQAKSALGGVYESEELPLQARQFLNDDDKGTVEEASPLDHQNFRASLETQAPWLKKGTNIQMGLTLTLEPNPPKQEIKIDTDSHEQVLARDSERLNGSGANPESHSRRVGSPKDTFSPLKSAHDGGRGPDSAQCAKSQSQDGLGHTVRNPAWAHLDIDSLPYETGEPVEALNRDSMHFERIKTHKAASSAQIGIDQQDSWSNQISPRVVDQPRVDPKLLTVDTGFFHEQELADEAAEQQDMTSLDLSNLHESAIKNDFYQQQPDVVKVEDAELDELVFPNQLVLTVAKQEQLNEALSLINIRQQSDGSAGMPRPFKQQSLRSRDNNGAVKPFASNADRDEDMNGGLPNATDPSQALLSDTDKISMAQILRQQSNAKSSSRTRGRSKPKQGSKLFKSPPRYIQLDSKGGEAAPAGKTYRSGSLNSSIHLVHLRDKFNGDQQEHGGLKKSSRSKSGKKTGVQSPFATLQLVDPSEHSQKGGIPRTPTSRMYLTLKQTNRGSASQNNLSGPTGNPPLARSRTTKNQKNRLPEPFNLHFEADGGLTPRTKRMLFSATKPTLLVHPRNSTLSLGLNQIALDATANNNAATINNSLCTAGQRAPKQQQTVATNKHLPKINHPSQINYRAGNFQQRSMDRQKRIMDIYKPQFTKSKSSGRLHGGAKRSPQLRSPQQRSPQRSKPTDTTY